MYLSGLVQTHVTCVYMYMAVRTCMIYIHVAYLNFLLCSWMLFMSYSGELKNLVGILTGKGGINLEQVQCKTCTVSVLCAYTLF